MKFEQIQPREGQFNFDYADELIHVSEQFGHKLRGHTLVWHNQTSDWVFEAPDKKVFTKVK